MFSIISKATLLLNDLFNEHKIPEHHGIEHALSVMKHSEYAIWSYNGQITEKNELIVVLASLLHDADDPKFFKKNKNNENAYSILNKLNFSHYDKDEVKNIIETIITLIKSVSTSSNKIESDKLEIFTKHPYFLYPKYSDRLEALGKIGIKRCYDYTLELGNPLYTEETKKAKTLDELNILIDKQRFIDYQNGKKSKSMIDHYYDKLLHLIVCDEKNINNNIYLQEIYKINMRISKDVCLAYGNDRLEEYLHEYVKI